MSAFTVLKEYPALKILAGVEKPYFVPGDKIVIGLHEYMLGDVFTFALEMGECPLKSLEQAQKRGHEIYYAFPLAACITSHKRPQEIAFGVEFGQVIKYCGKKFRIDKARNDNVTLTEV